MPGVAGFSGRLAESQAEATCLVCPAQDACGSAFYPLLWLYEGMAARSCHQSSPSLPKLPADMQVHLVHKVHRVQGGRTLLFPADSCCLKILCR